MIWFAAWYAVMAMVTWVLAHREINRGRQLAKNVSDLLEATTLPYWVLIASSMIFWPFTLWRLHRGFPEDAR